MTVRIDLGEHGAIHAINVDMPATVRLHGANIADTVLVSEENPAIEFTLVDGIFEAQCSPLQVQAVQHAIAKLPDDRSILVEVSVGRETAEARSIRLALETALCGTPPTLRKSWFNVTFEVPPSLGLIFATTPGATS